VSDFLVNFLVIASVIMRYNLVVADITCESVCYCLPFGLIQ